MPFPTTPLAHRYTDEELLALVPEVLPTGNAAGRGGRGGQPAALAAMTPEERQAFQEKQRAFFADEGVLATVTASARGESGTVFASNGSPRTGDPTKNIPSVAITAENYNRIARLLEHQVPVKLAFDIKTKFDTSNTDSFNVIAEIPGSTKPNELVMVGGHFDSWHMGTGATDNGAGSAVAMEVMRILKSLNLKMDRTVRMALWGGEEEGLLGSAAYVKEHFADPAVMKPTAEHDGFAGYFNIDNGTGRIRGIYLQGNEMARPIFEQWFAALKDLTPGVITIRNTGGTDHQSFDASDCRASSSFRTRWITKRARTTPTWTSTTASSRPTWSRWRSSRRSSCTTPPRARTSCRARIYRRPRPKVGAVAKAAIKSLWSRPLACIWSLPSHRLKPVPPIE